MAIRFLPDNRVALTLHFLLHGIHHYLPMDRLRLLGLERCNDGLLWRYFRIHMLRLDPLFSSSQDPARVLARLEGQ
jgi:hypothetical protein